MRAALFVVLVACQRRHEEPPQPVKPKPDAGVLLDGEACTRAIAAAATTPPSRRAKLVIDNCPVCGDWAPVLHWRTLPGEGGPTRTAIDERMAACGYCSTDARRDFMGQLDDARGTDSRAPWRALGKACGDKPDERFASGPWFALNAIAKQRAVAGLDIPLPAVSATGFGFELPASPVTAPQASRNHVTVTMKEVSIGRLPVAQMTPAGLVVTDDGAPYPGRSTPIDQLAPALAALTGETTIIAPRDLPAIRVADVVAHAGVPVHLAAVAPGSPEDWIVPGDIPVALTPLVLGGKVRTLELGASADPAIKELKATPPAGGIAIEVTPAATSGSLAKLLGALAFHGAHAAMITTKP